MDQSLISAVSIDFSGFAIYHEAMRHLGPKPRVTKRLRSTQQHAPWNPHPVAGQRGLGIGRSHCHPMPSTYRGPVGMNQAGSDGRAKMMVEKGLNDD